MGLYERVIGIDPNPKINTHVLDACVGEFTRGKVTLAQARTILATEAGGVPLTAGEETELATLRDTVTSIPVTGSAAQIADGRARRAARVKEIQDVLMLASNALPPYDTAAGVRAALGV